MDRVSPIEHMQAETRFRYGPVRKMIGDKRIKRGGSLLEGDEFCLWTTDGLAYHYSCGEGITIEREPDADRATEQLFLNGSVYAAVAAINGFMPVHASAVAWQGEVFAFTGPSGAGKSTLTAALGRLGLPMFCDDTLIIDLSGDRPMCLPGHKRLKLCPDAFALTGAERGDRVAHDLDKFFGVPASGTVDVMLPLAELTFLDVGEEIMVEQVRGAERLMRLQDDHYTQALYLAAVRPDRAQRFLQLVHLARTVKLTRFVRPRTADLFDSALARIAAHIRAHEGP
jgi:hypothetical protein